jgi:hypothetical protein
MVPHGPRPGGRLPREVLDGRGCGCCRGCCWGRQRWGRRLLRHLERRLCCCCRRRRRRRHAAAVAAAAAAARDGGDAAARGAYMARCRSPAARGRAKGHGPARRAADGPCRSSWGREEGSSLSRTRGRRRPTTLHHRLPSVSLSLALPRERERGGFPSRPRSRRRPSTIRGIVAPGLGAGAGNGKGARLVLWWWCARSCGLGCVCGLYGELYNTLRVASDSLGETRVPGLAVRSAERERGGRPRESLSFWPHGGGGGGGDGGRLSSAALLRARSSLIALFFSFIPHSTQTTTSSPCSPPSSRYALLDTETQRPFGVTSKPKRSKWGLLSERGAHHSSARARVQSSARAPAKGPSCRSRPFTGRARQ